MVSERVDRYFALARERHAIYLRRAAGEPRPWTDDPIFRRHRFTNVFRELDATTVWFREHVREPLRDRPEVLLATVVFHLFNRISTGEAVFQQPFLDGNTGWELFLLSGNVSVLSDAILPYCGVGPYTTGSYMTHTPTGSNKLDGMLWVIEQFATLSQSIPTAGGGATSFNWREMATDVLVPNNNSWSGIDEAMLGLRDVWSWFAQFPFIGPFNAYEFVSDLRWTALLDHAPDVMTWANPGPGCRRGLEWLAGGRLRRDELLPAMRELLTLSQSGRHWSPRYPPWEMREVEHWSCEVFKYQRVAAGGAGTRRRFEGGDVT